MISATVLTKNSEKTLAKTLDSLKDFKEVVVLDSGSTDKTLTIANTYPNVVVHSTPFLGFGPQHNYAAKLASHDWIFSIDSDEVLSDELANEILSLEKDPEEVYQIKRHNYFDGKHIKYCSGWHPDWIPRLYHRNTTHFSEDLVHERIVTEDFVVKKLKAPLLHTPFLEIGDFLKKMQHYSSLFAEQNQGEKGSLFEALVHSWFAFFRSYILNRGFLAGRAGFIISMHMGHTAFYKYLKLIETKRM